MNNANQRLNIRGQLPFLAMQCWYQSNAWLHMSESDMLVTYENAILFRGVGHVTSEHELSFIKYLNDKYHGLLNDSLINGMMN